VNLPICPLPHELDKSLRDCAAQNSAEEVCRFQEKADHIPLLEGNRTSQPFPLNPTDTLLRRPLAQFVITKYRDKVQEVALREWIRTIIRQVCKELGVQIVSGVLSRENMSICWWKSRRIIPSATSCGASRDAHHIGCRGSSRTQAHLGTAFLGARLPSLHHQRQHHGRCHPSVSSGARTYRRQPVGIQLLQVNPAAAPRRDHG
jgi:hypothetical protein